MWVDGIFQNKNWNNFQENSDCSNNPPTNWNASLSSQVGSTSSTSLFGTLSQIGWDFKASVGYVYKLYKKE